MNGESKRWELLEEKYNGVVVSAFFAAPQLDSLPLTSCLPSPGCWCLGSLVPWLLGSLAPWLLGSLAPLPAGG
jgi:hypothetical protein